jgi:hypothetical protein
MFSLLAVLAVMLSIGLIPIITTLLFVKKGRDDLEFQRELLPTAVQVEPLRIDRRLFRLSHAAMAGSFSMA